jgi:hypothetical protein
MTNLLQIGLQMLRENRAGAAKVKETVSRSAASIS